MSSIVGFIPAAVGGKKVALAHSGSTFKPDAESLEPLARLVAHRACGPVGRLLHGRDSRHGVAGVAGWRRLCPRAATFAGSAAAALAQAVATQKGAIFGGAIAILGVWILFKAQLDILEGTTRGITDILWAGSARIRFRGAAATCAWFTIPVLIVISVWVFWRCV